MFRIKLNIEIQEISVALLPNSSHGLSTRLKIFTSVFIFFLTCYGYGIECRFYCVQNKIIGTPTFFHPIIINFLAFRENSHFGEASEKRMEAGFVYHVKSRSQET